MAPWDELAYFTLPSLVNFTSAQSPSSPILKADPHRIAVVFSSADQVATAPASAAAEVKGASAAAPGVALSYTVPAGASALLQWARLKTIGVSTSPTVTLEWLRGADTWTIATVTTLTTLDQTFNLNLSAGDTIRWNVTVGATGSSVDALLSLTTTPALSSVVVAPAVNPGIGNGFLVSPGFEKEFTHKDWPGIPQLDWYASIPAGRTLSVMALTLTTWPNGTTVPKRVVTDERLPYIDGPSPVYRRPQNPLPVPYASFDPLYSPVGGERFDISRPFRYPWGGYSAPTGWRPGVP